MSQRFLDMVWREFSILGSVANAYGYTHNKKWLSFTIVNYIVIYSWIIGGMALLAYTNVLIKDNVSFLSQSSHFLIVGAVSMTCSVTLTLSRRKIEAFEQLFCDPESFAPYVKSEYFDGLKENTTQRKNYYIIFWVAMYGSCGVVCYAQPLIDSLANTKADVPVINGVWTNIPFAMWVPFDLEQNEAAWFMVFIFEGTYLLFVALQVICANVLCFTAIDRILDQMKSCIWAVTHLDERVKKMVQQRHKSERVEDIRKKYDEYYYDCIVQIVKHHLVIKEEFEKFIDLARFPIAVPFFGGAMLLGMALITITAEDDPRVGPKCMAAMLAISEAVNMYNACKAGQDFEEISIELHDALFYTKWYNRSEKCKKAVLIMRSGCVRPLQLTATIFLTLNIPLFSDLVNSAYSLFNVMRASRG